MKRQLELSRETTINDLPSELHVVIFGFCVENEDREVVRLIQFFTLSQVMRYWHSLIVDTVLPYAYTDEDLAESLHYTNWLTRCQTHRFTLLDLSDYTMRFFKSCDLPMMTRLERLRIVGGVRPILLDDITVLTNLRSLSVQHHNMLSGSAASLSNLQNLELLSLHRSPINLREVDFNQMPRLVELHLHSPLAVDSDYWHDRTMIMRLCHIKTLLIADHISINGHTLSTMTSLTSLTLFRTPMYRFECLTTLPHLVSLTVDSYFDNSVLELLTNLRSLSISKWGDYRNLLSDRTTRVLLPSSLTELDIDRCRCIGDNSLAPLTALTSLSIVRNHYITDAAIRHLSQLTRLVMGGRKQYITNEALTNLYSLRVLDLQEPHYITEPFTSFTHLTNLHTIEIQDALL